MRSVRIMENELMNLLGAARLSLYCFMLPNPIASLIDMDDVERLNLLKKIIGAQIYEEHHAEIRNKMANIGTTINMLRGNVQEFESHKENLMQITFNQIEGTREGVEGVERVCKESNISGLIGPIYKLIDCEEKYFTAVEIVAGKSLFHVVVDNTETAKTIGKRMNEAQAGRVTLRPLDQARTTCNVDDSELQASHMTPLLKLLKCSPLHKKALSLIFGNTMYLENLREITTHGYDYVTPKGFQFSKGIMRGGYYDENKLKLKFAKIIRENGNLCSEKGECLKDINNRIVQLLERERDKLVGYLETYKKEIAELRKSIDLERYTGKEEEELKGRLINSKKRRKISNSPEKLIADSKKQIEDLEHYATETRAMISEVDKEKDVCMQKISTTVNNCFGDVISKLVPGCSGKLTMIREEDRGPADNTEGGPTNFIGVKMEVSFPGQGETQSTVEKTVAGVALILAILECDPPPFYLFNGIIAKLEDTNYRHAVTDIISSLIEKTQFIVSWPEAQKNADKKFSWVDGEPV
ncbi:structural maintenance of chromosomes protein 3 [Lactuca sativa]|uniref:structural maintenance of chromosomes protein 3 n=1 Tax=Lactuca sativa TaxID=4236 RepID=UPI000CD89FA8|nr:structural maintenance of chromosomes protein 3 [Lactuca sativa]XP_023747758.1 structural maintenance of chromosomes protein 3 [Lactuca sativa]XP_042751753.1 structural maintenance of chromosomes protein 3 [Lactuca sativa]XP_052620637.1 structural maintenance of chromosomes protein 3 [Lactuca sativa]